MKPIQANAADYSAWSSIFDPTYYAEHYADANAYANGNVDLLWQHFVYVGIPNGRQASAEFNVTIYIQNYPDLQKAFGTNLIQYYVLNAFDLQYLQTITFILVIASLVQLLEIVLKKVSPSLYQALGIFLPLITTNCVILGVAINVIDYNYNLLQGVVFAFSTAIGYGLALTMFAGVRESLALVNVPEGMKGTPIALIVAGIMAMAFMGFSGVVKL